MAAAKQKEVTTHRVASIQFGMYTDEEVGVPPAAAPGWAVMRANFAAAVLELEFPDMDALYSHTTVFLSIYGACDHAQ